MSGQSAEIDAILRFIWEAELALGAATSISDRMHRTGVVEGLNLGNHDRLVTEARRLRAVLGDPVLSPGKSAGGDLDV